jgi:hypothetical protein
LEYISRSGIAGSCVVLFLVFCRSILFSIMALPFYNPNCTRGFQFPCSLNTILFTHTHTPTHPHPSWVSCISLMTSDTEHFFKSVGRCTSLEKCLKSSAHLNQIDFVV